jgi:very-short-patch-repair endonuclease
MGNMMLGRQYALYNNPTRHELLLEKEVAKLGLPYRFQHLELKGKANAIIDFAFPTIKVALEIDGPDHFTKAGLAKDKLRTARLNALGWRVVRLTNGEVEVDPVGNLAKVMAQFLR